VPITINISSPDRTPHKVLGETSGRSTAVSFLGLVSIGDAGIDAAYRNALAKIPQADALKGIRTDYKIMSIFGIITTYQTEVSGWAIQFPKEVGYPKPSPKKTVSLQLALPKSFFEGTTAHNIQMGLALRHGEGVYFGYQQRKKTGEYFLSPALTFTDMGNLKVFSFLGNVGISLQRLANKEGKQIPVTPVLEGGLGYHILKSGSKWHFFEWGFNLGFGFEISQTESYTLYLGLRRYIILTQSSSNFWVLSMGFGF
jgi:hypothetical protein